jgi:hypothetical protein
MQPPKEVELSRMEIDMNALRTTYVKRRTTIMDRTTLLDKGICILDHDKFMWI